MDMKIVYILIIAIGAGLVIAGLCLLSYKEKEDPEPEAITPSSWITHYNEHQSKLDPLETEFDSLHKVWWGFYNELNFEKMTETNDKMKILCDQIRVLNEKYKATRHE